MKRNKLLIYTTWMSLKNITVSESSQTQKTTHDSTLREMLEKVNHGDNKHRTVVAWGWEWGKGTECKGVRGNFLE